MDMKHFLSIFVALSLCNSAFAAQAFGNLTFASGRQRLVTTPIPDLLPRDNITEVCVLGTFVLYSAPNFEMDGFQWILYNYDLNEEPYCTSFVVDAWPSVRPVAHMVDTQHPFAALYALDRIQSDEFVVEAGEGLANITMPINSIIMRMSSVELFSEPNFTGDSFCILDCGELACIFRYMNHIPGESPFDITQTKSARLGCSGSGGSSTTFRKPDNSGSTQGFATFTD